MITDVDPTDEQTLVDARAAADEIGQAYDLGTHTEQRDAAVPDLNESAVAGWANARRISRGVVMSTQVEARKTRILCASTDARDAETYERKAHSDATAASAAEKQRDHMNRIDSRYSLAVELDADVRAQHVVLLK